ncbi:MAG: DUF1697 domain-containing protein [Acidobacteriota bacterium]
MAAFVVFLKGVNVGGNRKFSPAAVARDMADLGMVNVGAAGTFVARRAAGAGALRAELSRRLPFEAVAMTCTGRELLDLVRVDPFASRPADGGDAREMVTVLEGSPKTLPRLPLRRPAGPAWQIEYFLVIRRFALAYWRPVPGRLLYIDALKDLGVDGTTRTWKTILKIRDILDA